MGRVLDWNDLRYFLAVAQTGSTLAAGRELGVSQTTVARRITALETALHLLLFERRPAGYRLTPIGETLLVQARAVAATTSAFTDAAASQAREISGTVKVTTAEIYAVTVLAPILRDLHDAHPAIRIELDTNWKLCDLAAGAADIAVRSSSGPTEAGLVGRRIAGDPWTMYCSRGYAALHGQPRSRRELHGHTLVGGGGDGVWDPYKAWLEENGLTSAVATHYDTTLGLLAAVRAGVGLAVLPSFAVDSDPDLLRCLPPVTADDRGIWLLTHERLRHTPRIRVVLDFLAVHLSRRAREQRAKLG